MANPHKGEARVELADRDLTLRFDLDAYAAIEAPELGDHRVNEVLAEMAGPYDPELKRAAFRHPRMKTQQLLLFAGTRHHHPELSLEECGELVVAHNAPILWPMLRALAVSLGKEKEVAEDEAGGEGSADEGPTQPAPGISTDS